MCRLERTNSEGLICLQGKQREVIVCQSGAHPEEAMAKTVQQDLMSHHHDLLLGQLLLPFLLLPEVYTHAAHIPPYLHPCMISQHAGLLQKRQTFYSTSLLLVCSVSKGALCRQVGGTKRLRCIRKGTCIKISNAGFS